MEQADDHNEPAGQAENNTSTAPKIQHHDLHDCVIAERFEVTQLIGLGGMGAVWQALDRKLERNVAIKVLPPMLTRHPQYRERFLREAQAAAKLREHPHIVPVYHCGIDRERESLYLAMRLVRGISLRERVTQSGPVAEPEALELMSEVLSALGFAHEHGIVHRDVKPDNILIDEATGNSRLTDFGLVRFEDAQGSRLTAVGQIMGTPQWMSPEQCEAKPVDGRSDLYSAGLCFYYMLVGENPFTATSTAQVFINQLQKAAPSLREKVPALSEPLERFVLILLAKPPGRRFPDAQAAQEALEQVKQGEMPARPATASQRTEPVSPELEQAAKQAVLEQDQPQASPPSREEKGQEQREEQEQEPQQEQQQQREEQPPATDFEEPGAPAKATVETTGATDAAAAPQPAGTKRPKRRAASQLNAPASAPQQQQQQQVRRSPKRLAPPSGLSTAGTARANKNRVQSGTAGTAARTLTGGGATRARTGHRRRTRAAAKARKESNGPLIAGISVIGAILFVLLLALSC